MTTPLDDAGGFVHSQYDLPRLYTGSNEPRRHR